MSSLLLRFAYFSWLSLLVVTAEGHTIRLLTIGNSFSRNATNHLDELASTAGHSLIHNALVIGGASLQVHAEKMMLAGKDRLYANGKDLIENLKADRWDYVTIQQASIKSHNFATFQPHAGLLHDLIQRHAPQAELLIHQTWAYRVDDPRFSIANAQPGEPKTQEEMYHGLTIAYEKLAVELNVRIIPVGDAFFRADTHPRWGYRIDPKPFVPQTAQEPQLPLQTHSLHIGWRWARKDGNTKLSMDGHHANLAGEYLGACVWYEVLFGESPVGHPYVPSGLKPDYARFLQETAHQAVQARAGSQKDASAKK